MKKQHFKIFALSFFIFTKVNAQSAGDIVITEFMVDPFKVSDAAGEWFEVYNTSVQTIDMNGWHIHGGSKNHTITKINGLIIQPGSFLLFSMKADSIGNGGVPFDYVYSGVTFSNASGKIMISNAGGQVIDSVAYTGSTPGKSWSLDPQHFKSTDNDLSINWCSGNQLYGLGDFGTPKQPNPSCTVNAIPEVCTVTSLGVYVNNAELTVRLNEMIEKQQWDIVDISGKVIQSGYIPEPTTNFFIPLNRTNSGIYFCRLHQSGLTLKFIVK